jgi:hypothetical protein
LAANRGWSQDEQYRSLVEKYAALLSVNSQSPQYHASCLCSPALYRSFMCIQVNDARFSSNRCRIAGKIPVHSRVPTAVVDCNAPWRILQVWRSPLHHFQRCRSHTEATYFHLLATMFPLASRGFEYRPAPDGGWSISRPDCGPLRLASDTCSIVQRQAVGSCGPQHLFHLAPRSACVWGFLSRQRWWVLEAEECLTGIASRPPQSLLHLDTNVCVGGTESSSEPLYCLASGCCRWP